MTDRVNKARKLANWLICENQDRSWRAIAKECFPETVKPGTLNRIANSCGEWIPKDKGILIALGLIEAPEPVPPWLKQIKKRIAKMAKQTRQELGLQKGK